MAIKRPDIYEHNNPAYSIADSDFVRGGFRTKVADLTALYSLSGNSDQLKEHSTLVYVSGETKYYILVDKNNIGNVSGWNEFQTGGAGTITGATNGLSVSGENVILGGNPLTGNTTIDADNLNLSINNINDFQVKTSGDTTILGIDENGFLLSFSGGSVSFEDNGGMKYGGDYSSEYTPQSIPDVNFVTGQTSGYLKLDQTIEQNVTGSQPIFVEGIKLGDSPSTSQISGHTKGKMYYDTEYETVSVDIGDETTIQLAQESVRYVYNNTGIVIGDGAVVYDTGNIHSSGGVDTVEIALAIATGVTSASVIGVTTQVIPNGEFGFITTRGNINRLNTLTSPQYSGITAGSELYLSATVAGYVTDVPPISPNINVEIGRLITKDAVNGKIYVLIFPSLSLNDLNNVSVPTPALDNVLKWNGVEWVNGVAGSTSAGSGVNFYYTTPIINSITPPAGLSEDGTAGNGIQVSTLSKNPVTTGGTLVVAGLNGSDIRAFVAWGQDAEIGRTTIDSGLWEFYDYVNVSSVVGTTYLIHGVYQIMDITGSTITITGAGNSRTATITSGEFGTNYFNPDARNTEASYLETEGGIFQITASASTNQVTITVPTGYVNETAVSGSTWNPLFTGSTESIEHTVTELYQTKIIAPSFIVNETDRLGQMMFVQASGSYTLSLSYNGTSAASFVISPFVTLHNDLPGLQGGTGDYRGHISELQNTNLNNQSGINTGDETKSTIESKLIGEINSHYHPYSGLTGTPDLTVYQTISGFTGYTASTQSIIGTAITGATNFGTGTTVYSGATDRNLHFNTIVGGGLTSVQKIGNEIVISSSGATGGGEYVGESPSAVNLCGISIGYVLTGKTVSCIIQDMLVPELFGTITAPSIGINLTCTGIKEIGCNISQTVTGNFNQGCINPQYCSVSDKRSGLPNAYQFTGTGMPVPWQTCTSLSAVQVNASYNVVSGVQSWGVTTRYDEGSPALGSKGTEYCAALVSGCTAAASGSITGILPWYWGTHSSSTITSDIVTGGTKVVENVGASTPIIFNGTTEYLWFAAPAGTTTKTKWWVCAANAGDIGGVGNLWAASCPLTVSSGQGCWSSCSFDIYVTCGITSTAAGIPMCLYY